MKFNYGVRLCYIPVLMIYLAAQVNAQDKLSNPYEILAQHYKAIGGLDKINSIKTTHAQGTITILSSDLAGTFEMWTEKPLRMKMIIDWGIMQTVVGDNGAFEWRVDANGKILKLKDDLTLKRREVQRLMEYYEHLDKGSAHFNLAYQGIENINNKETYVVEITNDINETVEQHYYSTDDYYLIQKTITTPQDVEHVFYSDFRTISDVILPFQEIIETVSTGEKQKFEYTEYEFDLALEPDFFDPPSEDVEDFAFSNGNSSEDIPFDFAENDIYIPVVINGREKLWVLDCGASVTVIDSFYAADLGLEFQGPLKAWSATGIVNLYFVTLPSFSLQGIIFREQKVMTMNLRDMFQSLLGLEIAGVLGYDFLSRFVTKIDYAHEKLSFYDPQQFEYHGDGKVIHAPLSEERMFRIPVIVDNTYSGTWQLDIGASGVDIHYHYARAHDLLERPGIDVMFFGAAGPGMARRSRFKTMAVDEYVVHDIVIDIPQEAETGSFADESLIGNIGNSFLRHFILYLDYYRQQVIFEKGDNFDRKFPESKSGLGLRYNKDHALEVFFIALNTPAAEAGFKKGDIVTAINGIKMDYFNGIIAIRRLFREKAGTKYVFTVIRQGKTKQITMILRDLY